MLVLAVIETSYKDIAFGPKNMGLTEDEIDKRVRRAAEFVGVTDEMLEKSPFDLSGGEKRRAALAGILAMEPDVLVLDEPTAGLDPKGREMLFSAVNKYKEKNNAGVIIVSHSMEDLSRLCDKLLVLSGGQVKMFDTVENVFSSSSQLNAMGLDVPMVTRVLLNLKDMGIDVNTNAFTVNDATDAILKAMNGGQSNG